MALFTTLIGLGIANIKRPERHKRLTVLAGFSLRQAPVVRLITTIVDVGPGCLPSLPITTNCGTRYRIARFFLMVHPGAIFVTFPSLR